MPRNGRPGKKHLTKPVFLGLMIAVLCSSGTRFQSVEMVSLTPHATQHVYATWFDGVLFQPDIFVATYRKNGFSDSEIRMVSVYLDRFGSPVFLTHEQMLTDPQTKALAWRQDLTAELATLKSPQAFEAWRNRLWPRFQQRTQAMSYDDKVLFSEYAGVSPHEWDLIEAVQPLVATNVDVIAEANGLRVPDRGSILSTAGWVRAVGPYSVMPSTDQNDLEAGVWVSASVEGDELFKGSPKMRANTSRQAVSMMEQDVTDHGLLALRVPMGALRSLDDVNRLSERLNRYATALGVRTQMGAGALGLNGRVMLILGSSSRPMANADTSKIHDDVRVIHSTWSSLAHEWFHAFSGTVGDNVLENGGAMWTDSVIASVKDDSGSRKTARAFSALANRLQHERPNAQQWIHIKHEAQQLTQEFLKAQWNSNVFERMSKNIPTHTEDGAVQFSLQHLNSSSPYTAAVVASHFYWINNMKKDPQISTWVARRTLMDRMLQQSSYTPETLQSVQLGYFSSTEEWVAAAFQADMNEYMGVRGTAISLITTPLPTEAQDYARHWTAFFKSVRAKSGQPWNEQPGQAAGDHSLGDRSATDGADGRLKDNSTPQ